MWTGGKAPVLPLQGTAGDSSPAAASTSTSAASTPKAISPTANGGGAAAAAVHPPGVKAELEALRQRGLATLLNKHFTETTKKLAAEKAAADAALRDLERRKANTSEFQPSGDGELSPFDTLYLSCQQWRTECRKKERETLLLYQRYVDKFGNTGQVQVPLQKHRQLLPKYNSNNSYRSLPSPSKNRTRRSSSPTRSVGGTPPPAGPPPRPASDKVQSMAKAIEATLEEYLRNGAISLPSVELLGKTETYQSSFTKEEAEFRNYYRRQLELRGVDAKAAETAIANGDLTAANFNEDSQMLQQANAFLRTIGEVIANDEDDDEDDDDEYDDEEGADGLGPLIVHDRDDDSVLSGITFNSAMTREILDDCERTVVTFLQEEQEAIRKIMDDEDQDAMTAASTPSQAGSESMQAADQAEHMVKQMKGILENFQKKNNEDGSASGTNGDETVSVTKEAQRYPTDNSDEHWMVYYDEYYQREYYHELNTNRTQWEPPRATAGGGMSDQSSNTSRSTPILSSADVMPETGMSMMLGSKSESRISQYRRKRRRRRKRRLLAAAAFLAVSVLGGTGYWFNRHRQNPNEQFGVLVLPYVGAVLELERVHSFLDSALAKLQASVEVLTGEAQRKQQQDILVQQRRLEEEAKKEKERVERKRRQEEEEARKKAVREEAERKARAAAKQRKLEAEREQQVAAAQAQPKEDALAKLCRRVGGAIPMAYYVEDLPLLMEFGDTF